MSVDLPEPIAAYIAAENGHDTEAVAGALPMMPSCETKAELSKAWPPSSNGRQRPRRNTSTQSSLSRSSKKTARLSLSSQVAGNFPGSPVNLEFVFGLEGNKITSLEIR